MSVHAAFVFLARAFILALVACWVMLLLVAVVTLSVAVFDHLTTRRERNMGGFNCLSGEALDVARKAFVLGHQVHDRTAHYQPDTDEEVGGIVCAGCDGERN